MSNSPFSEGDLLAWIANWAQSGQLETAANNILDINTSNLQWLRLLNEWKRGDLKNSPQIEWIDNNHLNGALGAFDNTNKKILINHSINIKSKKDVLENVIAEELGHWMDDKFNSNDTKGDEGQLFAAEIFNKKISSEALERIKNEDDYKSLEINNQITEIEQQRLFETEFSSLSINEDGKTTFSITLTSGIPGDVNAKLELGTRTTTIDGNSSHDFTFNASNFFITQSIELKPVDDLIISGNRNHTIDLSFSSATDNSFDGLTSEVTFEVIDNDFQRSVEPSKVPSEGNNYIIYDYQVGHNYADYYTGDSDSNYKRDYRLANGADKLEITGSLRDKLRDTRIEGGGGNDTISGATLIDSGDGDDTLITFDTSSSNSVGSTWNTQQIAAGSGNDSISGGSAFMIIAGGSGDDTITGSTTHDVIWGDHYNSLNLGYGSTLATNQHYGFNANSASSFYRQRFGSAIADNDITNGNDSILAGVGNDWVDGGSGNDTLQGESGNDTLDGGDGHDSILGGEGSNLLIGAAGNDTLTSQDGNDTITGGDGSDLINAGEGNNRIDSEGDNDSISSGSGNDYINAGGGDDSITSGAGNDTLLGSIGHDSIWGGLGNDSIEGNDGNDSLYGQGHNDTISGYLGDDNIYGDDGNDFLHGGSGNDTLLGGVGDDYISGDDENDSLSGGLGTDTLFGGSGIDTLSGGDGNDSLDGGNANDSLSGGAGNDSLTGGLGSDTLSGGGGADTFFYSFSNLLDLHDTILDFAPGSNGDKLDLESLHSSSIRELTDLQWSGTEFAYAHKYINFIQDGDNTLIQYDRDGLNTNYNNVTIASLSNVNATQILPGINSSPSLSDQLFLLEQVKLVSGLAEDSGASITYRAVLGQAPTSDVTLTVTGGDQIHINGSNQTSTLTFNQDNWWITQDITITAIDDLLIEGNIPASIEHNFFSADTNFNNLKQTLSVNIIDNDFQRSVEPSKVPSEGNNYIIYDYQVGHNYADYYTGDSDSNYKRDYRLANGADKLEITGSLRDKLRDTRIEGGGGNDTISGATLIDSGDGDDTLITFDTSSSNSVGSTWNTQQIAAGSGNDSISGGSAFMIIAGGSGDDTITGSTTHDVIWGDHYNSLNLGYGSTLATNQHYGFNANSASSFYRQRFGSAIADNDITNGNDSILAGVGNDWVDGGSGNDTLQGESGNDTLDGGDGHDSILGGEGSNLLIGAAGNDTLTSQDGNDTITGGDGSDLINAGEGNNRIDSEGDNDSISSGSGNDYINAGGGDDSITSGAGNDTLLGSIGHDSIWGGLGNDSIEGNDGNDSLYGQGHNDTISGYLGDDNIYGDDGNDFLHGGSGNDTLLGGVGDDYISGDDENDSLSGGLGTDTLFGGSGIDTLSGGDGNDSLDGGNANDSLSGGAGNDSLTGGLGSDTLSGGGGADTFFYSFSNLLDLHDTILDFAPGSNGDKLDLESLHSSSIRELTDLQWSGTEFAYAHKYINFIQDGDNTLIQYDRDGLNTNYNNVTIASLSNVNATQILPGINSSPSLSDQLFLLEQVKLVSGLAEDSGASITYRAVLGQAPTSDVTLTVTGGDQIHINGSNQTSTLTFNQDNWWITQDITITAIDDLLIEGNIPASIEHNFFSADTNFNNLKQTLSVNIIDNDFQRSVEPSKVPSEGNNYIIYDYQVGHNYADYYTGDSDSNYKRDYRLANGADKLEITGSLRDKLRDTRIEGGGGNDTISGATLIDSGDGDDTLITFDTSSSNSVGSTWNTQQIAAGSGNDSISGGSAFMIIAGGSGDDTITGSTTHDVIWGDHYNSLNLGYGSTLATNQHYGFNANSASSFYRQRFGSAIADNDITNGNDSILAGVGNDWVDGGSGNDTLQGESGNDTLDGGDGHDSILGGEGSNLLIGAAGNDTLTSQDGNDTITGGDGSDLINAGEGNNRIDSEGDNDSISSGSGNDYINAGGGDDSITSGAGNDTLLGSIGHDSIWGGLGNDSIEGNDGNDSLYGQGHNDTISGYLGDDNIYGDDGNDFLHGGSGNDTLLGGVGDDYISGDDENDSLSGGLGTDTLFGGSGIDTLSGGDGNDSLDGGNANDSLSGGAGNDSLTGGLGSDTLSGGGGADTFFYSFSNLLDLHDTILDFAPGSNGDKLDLESLHSSSIRELTDLQWSGTEFAYAHKYINFIQDGDNTLIQYDRDGLNTNYNNVTIASLSNVNATQILPGINSSPSLSDQLFLLEQVKLVSGLAEDSGASITYRAVLGQAPTSDVTLTVTGGDQIHINGSNQTSTLTFNQDNWWITQDITITAIDDLLIEGNIPASIEHNFFSADTNFNNLKQTLSVNIIDNDFQRSVEPSKVPSEGNNYIIYDYQVGHNYADYYTGDSDSNYKRDYRLANGADKLEITGSLRDKLRDTRIEGGGGNDTISGATLIDSGDGDDTLITFDTSSSNSVGSTWNTQQIAAGSGNDSISGGSAFMIIAGGSGDDTITGSTTHDVIWGDHYNSLNLGYGSTLATNQHYGFNANSASSFYRQRFGSAIADNDITNGNDSILAGVGNDWVDGGSGNDTLQGESGNDTLDGGDGHDSILGGEGSNLLIGAAGNDTLTSQDGNDTITGGDGSDLINAGEGNNRIDSEGDNDSISSGSGNDYINAGGGDDSITSGAGNDTLLGSIGHDSIWGGLGNDSIEGNDGNDSLYGQGHNDTISGYLGDDNIYGDDGNDFLHGGSGNDTLLGGVGDDYISGDDENDSLSGGLGTDTLFGGSGIDTLSGGDGNDSLDGGNANDSLSGGAGNDSLTGGLGSDTLSGGGGADTFFYSFSNLLDLHDTILDFAPGSNGDKLDLESLHSSSIRELTDLQWSGTEFAYAHKYINFIQDGDNTLIQYDRDGLNTNYNNVTIASLSNVNATQILPGINSSPSLSDQLFLLEQVKLVSGLAEDSGASITYRAVLGQAPTSDVTLTVTGGDQIHINGSNQTSTLTFNQDNWWITQDITITAIDDLLIEGNIPASIEHNFFSADTNFNNLKQTLSVNIIDNDFQRSVEPSKVPSEGNNYIIYDYQVGHNYADYYTGDSDSNYKRDYRLANGADKLEITGSLRDKLRDTRIEGGGGNDTISGATLIDSGDGDDTLITFDTSSSNSVGSTWNTQQIAAGSGNDSISGGSAFMIIAGGSGDDTITGSTTHDVIWGDHYNSLNLGYGSTLATNQHYGFNANSASSFYRQRFGSAIADNDITNGNDSILAGVGNDWVDGGSGNDTLQGESGNDTLDGGDGHDSILGGEGSNLLIGAAGNDTLTSQDGNDTITGGDGSDLINAGEGNNRIDSEGDNDSISSGSGNDYINAGGGDDSITSGAGNDTLLGSIGHDSIWGGLGNDSIEGNDGNDSLYGQGHNDTISGYLGDDNIYGDDGNDFLHGGSGNDTLLGGVGDDYISGDDENDSLSGGLGTDTLFGGSGIDTLSGGDGNDSLDGGNANDSLSGGAGNDSLTGGLGSDTLSGGGGADTFFYSFSNLLDLHDTILDFAPGSNGDKLDLESLHSSSIRELTDLQWSGTEFAYAHKYINFIQDGDNTLIQYDRDGLNTNYNNVTIASLSNVNATQILPGINSSPSLSDQLFLLEQVKLVSGLAEDSGASITYRAVLGQAPTSDVTLTVTGGDQIHINGSNQTSTLTFNQDNWWITQDITITAIDDLLIEGNIPASIEHNFFSADTNFNNLKQTLSVNIIDNDFQRSVEPSKVPSEGNNYIIYDYQVGHNYADYYTGDSDSNYKRDYRLANGADKLEITGSLRDKLRDTRIEGGGGNDTISGATLIDSGDGDDTLITFDTSSSNSVGSTWNTQQIAAGSGNDSISGGSAFMIIAGGSGDDTITGSTTHDVIWGDHYNSLNLGYGSTLATNQHYGFNANSASSFYRQRFGSAIADNDITNGNDSILAGVGNDWVDGGSGNDTLQGESGNDTLDGGDGHDSILGGEGSNLLIGAAGNDTLTSQDGNDTITGGDGSDLINAGEGNNRIDSEGDNDSISSGSGNDYINAGGGDDSITSGAGNDTLLGSIGHDSIWGGLGNDSIEGNDGNDSLYGQGHNDTISGYLGDDNIYGDDGNDFLHGGSGNDTLLGGVGDDYISGDDENDSLSGGLGTDTLFGGSGIDTLSGGDGNDSLDGGNANDSLSGGAGNDSLTGGLGSDTLSGGGGADTFFYSFSNLLDLHDTILDFAPGSNGDKLDLESIHSSNDLATFPADNYPFSLGYYRLIKDGNDTLIGYDKDGFNDDYNAKVITRLISVEALDLVPDNFVAGAASNNYGFQRNGAIVSLEKLNNKIIYKIRLWGGSPSASVLVTLTNKEGTQLGSINFNESDWDQTKTLQIEKDTETTTIPEDISNLIVNITSNDVNYNSSGVTMAIRDNKLISQVLPLSQNNISIFDTNETTREIKLVTDINLDNVTIPNSFKLTPIQGDGSSISATPIIRNNELFIVLGEDEKEWTGSTIYQADPDNLSPEDGINGLRLTIQQRKSYILNIESSETTLIEGNGNEIVDHSIKIKLDSIALNDISLEWSISSYGDNSIDKYDFKNGVMPSGSVTIFKGQNEAIIELPISRDLVQEKDETMTLNIINKSDDKIENISSQLSLTNDDTYRITGNIRYWNNNQAIESIKMNIANDIVNISEDGSIQFRNITRNSETGIIRSELWTNSYNNGLSNFNLAFSKQNDENFSFNLNNEVINNDWIISKNESNSSLKISSISSTALTGDKMLGVYTSSLNNNSTNTAYLSYGKVGSIDVRKTIVGIGETIESSNGIFEYNSNDGQFDATITKDPITGIDSRAINSQDALMALQMSTGSLTDSSISNQEQWIAADVDYNDIINARDAWFINEYAVGIIHSDNSSGTWEFINESHGLTELNKDNAGIPTNALVRSISINGRDEQMNITAILNGDIDGSFINI
ncbi:calcium-binding protein [Prochlorococcus marinus]|uniref:calcium-binding protein n=1 Tax=Prochlorococcus marinus TaxID=1219 RepID=UPI0022B48C8A|nr:calcium-binding protein [Prochlorococcus marinus]